MSGYIREIEKSFTFEGQVVKCVIRPIEYKSYLALDKINHKTDIAGAVMYMAEIVREFVTLVTPPTAADGSAVTIEELCSKAYFTDLLAEICRAVIDTGRINRPLTSSASSPSG